MGSTCRLALGIMGNATSLLLYAAPIFMLFIGNLMQPSCFFLQAWIRMTNIQQRMGRVIIKRSTEEFSCTPYIIALLNCALYTWYGLPVISNEWENLVLVTTNGIGTLLEFSFVLIYLQFASSKGKRLVWFIFVPTVLVFFIVALVSECLLVSHHKRKVLVGSVAVVSSVAMYGSPLLIVKHVIETKSVEFMPFYLSLFSFLSSSSWMAYGFLGHDLFVAAPNLVGSPLGLLQLALYFVYKRKEEGSPQIS